MEGWTGGFSEELWDLHFEDGSKYGNPLHKISEWTTSDRMIALQISGWPTVNWATWADFEPLAKKTAKTLGVDTFKITTTGDFHSFEQSRTLPDGLIILDVSIFDEKYHDVHMLSVFCDPRDLDRGRVLIEDVVKNARWKWFNRRLPLLGELGDDEVPPPDQSESQDTSN